MSSPVILCTAGYDHTIKFWEAPTGVCYRSLQVGDTAINTLSLTPDKQYLAAGGNPAVTLFEINSNNQQPVRKFEGHKGNVMSIQFQKNNRWMMTASEDKSIKIWDIRAAGCQRDYEAGAALNCAVIHPNQGEVISGDDDGNIRVWDLTTNTCSHALVPDGTTPIRWITVAQDASMLIACNNHGTVFVWRMTNKDSDERFEAIAKIEAHSTYALKCILSPDAKQLATCSADKTIKLWNVDDNFALDQTFTGHQRWVWDIHFSADSAYLISASSDKTARLWDIKAKASILEYTGHHKSVTCVTLNDSSEM